MALPLPTLTFEQVAGLLEGGAQTVRAETASLGAEVARWHQDRARLKHILTNVQAHIWPNMGNAQRFSEID